MSAHNRLSYLAMMSLQDTQQQPTASDAAMLAMPTSHFAWSPQDIDNIGLTLIAPMSCLTVAPARPFSVQRRRKSSPTRPSRIKGPPRRPSQTLKRKHILQDTHRERADETHGLERLSLDEGLEEEETVAKRRKMEKDGGAGEKVIVGGVVALQICRDEAEV